MGAAGRGLDALCAARRVCVSRHKYVRLCVGVAQIDVKIIKLNLLD